MPRGKKNQSQWWSNRAKFANRTKAKAVRVLKARDGRFFVAYPVKARRGGYS